MLRSVLLALILCPLSSLALGQTALPTPALTVKTGSNITLTWTAPTKNTDGSVISGAITYNLYNVTASGSTVLANAKGISTTSSQRTNLNAGTPCYAVTAVVNSVESAQTQAICVLVTATPTLTPNPPTNPQVQVTLS